MGKAVVQYTGDLDQEKQGKWQQRLKSLVMD